MIKIRLKRYGRKQRPSYRIVAMDSRVKRDGKAIEELGFYNPLTDETHLKFGDYDRGTYWRRVCISNLIGDMNSLKI